MIGSDDEEKRFLHQLNDLGDPMVDHSQDPVINSYRHKFEITQEPGFQNRLGMPSYNSLMGKPIKFYTLPEQGLLVLLLRVSPTH